MAARGLPPPLGPEIPNDNPDLFRGATWRVETPCSPPRVFSEPSVDSLHYPGSSAPELAPANTRTRRQAQVVQEPSAPRQQVAGSSAPPAPLENLVRETPPDADVPSPAPERATKQEPRAPEPTRVEANEPVRLVELEPVAKRKGGEERQGSNDFERFVGSVVQVALKRGETRAAAQLKRFLETGELALAELPEASRNVLVERGYVVDDGGSLRTAPVLRTVLSSWRRTLSGEDSELDASRDETLDQWASALLGAWLGCDPESLPTLRRALRKSGVLAFGMRAA